MSALQAAMAYSRKHVSSQSYTLTTKNPQPFGWGLTFKLSESGLKYLFYLMLVIEPSVEISSIILVIST